MAVITDKFGKASIDTDYAIATTVEATRTAGVTVLEAVDLSKFADDTPVFFVTYKKTTNPTTGEVTVVDLVSWKGLVNTGANTLTNMTLAPGYTDLGNDIGDFIECIPTAYWENSLIEGIFVGHNPDGTFKLSALKSALGNDGNLVDSLNDIISDYVVSGGVWSIVSGLNGTMTLLTAYIDGYKNTLSAIASRAFTVSKDTYVDILRNVTTNAFSAVYTEVANGAAAPALAANSIRLAKVVTNGSAITSIVQVGTDGLGNSIRPLTPLRDHQINSTIAFVARRTTDQTNVVTGTATKVNLNVEDFDASNNFDNTTNYRFVAPYSGVYHFSGSVKIDAPGVATSVYIRKNNTTNEAQATIYTNLTTDDVTAVTSVSLYLAAGDYIELFCAHFAGANRNILGSGIGEVFLSGHLVGRV